MNWNWGIGILTGGLLPVVIFIYHYVVVTQSKKSLEKEIGRHVQMSWSILYRLYPLHILVNLFLLSSLQWANQPFHVAIFVGFVLLTAFLIFPFQPVKEFEMGLPFEDSGKKVDLVNQSGD